MYRMVDTGTWDDPWFADLEPDAKLLFLYLLTNYRSRPTHFTLMLRRMAFDTGLSRERVEQCLDALGDGVFFGHETQTVVLHERWRFIGSDRLPKSRWEPLRQTVFQRDDFTCAYCGVRGGRLECDHVIPISRGGTNEVDNLVTACCDCNRSKRAKLLEERC